MPFRRSRMDNTAVLGVAVLRNEARKEVTQVHSWFSFQHFQNYSGPLSLSVPGDEILVSIAGRDHIVAQRPQCERRVNLRSVNVGNGR